MIWLEVTQSPTVRGRCMHLGCFLRKCQFPPNKIVLSNTCVQADLLSERSKLPPLAGDEDKVDYFEGDEHLAGAPEQLVTLNNASLDVCSSICSLSVCLLFVLFVCVFVYLYYMLPLLQRHRHPPPTETLRTPYPVLLSCGPHNLQG